MSKPRETSEIELFFENGTVINSAQSGPIIQVDGPVRVVRFEDYEDLKQAAEKLVFFFEKHLEHSDLDNKNCWKTYAKGYLAEFRKRWQKEQGE